MSYSARGMRPCRVGDTAMSVDEVSCGTCYGEQVISLAKEQILLCAAQAVLCKGACWGGVTSPRTSCNQYKLPAETMSHWNRAWRKPSPDAQEDGRIRRGHAHGFLVLIACVEVWSSSHSACAGFSDFQGFK